MSLFTVVWLIMLIPSITLHEFMHGWAAYKLGDPTAKNAGRLTLNPIKSIDPFGSIILPLMMFLFGGAIFGYAKPVPYNPRFFKNVRQGEIIVGLAGPGANFLLALVGAALAWIGIASVGPSLLFGRALVLIGSALAVANLVLMFFNLIPIPPLDGSSVIPLFLPNSMLPGWYGLQRYAFGIFIVLIFGIPFLLQQLGIGFSPLQWYFDHTAMAMLEALLPPVAF